MIFHLGLFFVPLIVKFESLEFIFPQSFSFFSYFFVRFKIQQAITVVLVTLLCWWLYDSVQLRILVTESNILAICLLILVFLHYIEPVTGNQYHSPAPAHFVYNLRHQQRCNRSSRLHRCRWRMLDTKCVCDNFEMLVTVLADLVPRSSIF